MTQLRLLDCFCGAGGAAAGYSRAGFEVTGIDIKPQPRFPFRFIQGDALALSIEFFQEFDLIHASPPCQAHTALRKMWNAKPHGDLIPQTRALLKKSGRPWVMENVPGAPLEGAFMLCGSMFGLVTVNGGAELRRHRYFEANWFVGLTPQCNHGLTTLGVYGGHVRDRCRTITVTGHTPQQNVQRNRVRETFTADDARVAMGIDWMTMEGLSQAIPPAYSEFIARAWLGQRRSEAA